jgi:hypothetical protein
VDWLVSLSHNSFAMKNLLIACLMSLCTFIPALCQQQLDAATKEDVEELLVLTGARQQVQQIWAEMAKQAATSAADSYRMKHPNATPLELRKVGEVAGQSLKASLKVVSIDELIDAIIPVYQRHLTHADAQNIVDFYNSAAGQKLLKQMPAMMSESMQAVQPIIAKHLPEMEAAAEKAAENSMKTAPSGTGNPTQ